MKKTDSTIRTVKFFIDSHEINQAIVEKYRIVDDLKTGDQVNYYYEFVKEGSPEYTTNKIKCTITIVKSINS